MRSYRAPLLISLYSVFLLAVSIGALLMMQREGLTLGNLRIGLETYVYLVVMQFLLIVLVAPALTAGAISGERERQTLDLLLCTRVGAFQIVIGKLFSTLAFLALMIFSSLPALAVTLFFGGVAFVDMLVALSFLVLCAFACCAIGIFFSSVFKRSVTSTVFAYLAVFVIGVGTLAFPLLFQQATLTRAVELSYQVTSGFAGAPTGMDVLRSLPELLCISPIIGLLSILVNQTGLLQRTVTEFVGLYSYSFSGLYNVVQYSEMIAYINMAFLFCAGALFSLFSVAFIKPSGRRARRRQ
jgi:ABC-type transport system involved in multi-copper enzyme maturation permease subunit